MKAATMTLDRQTLHAGTALRVAWDREAGRGLTVEVRPARTARPRPGDPPRDRREGAAASEPGSSLTAAWLLEMKTARRFGRVWETAGLAVGGAAAALALWASAAAGLDLVAGWEGFTRMVSQVLR